MAAPVAAIAGVSALAAYVNGKYHITQDLRAERKKKRAGEWYDGLGMFTFFVSIYNSKFSLL